MLGDRDVLAGPACVRRDQYIDEDLRLWIASARQPERDVGEPPRKPIACHLRVAEILQAIDDDVVRATIGGTPRSTSPVSRYSSAPSCHRAASMVTMWPPIIDYA